MKAWHLCLTIILCAGCGGGVHVHREYSELKKDARQVTGTEIVWQRVDDDNGVYESFCTDPSFGLSRQEAVRIALSTHPQLQAAFEELGIAKSDLRQAGFYTNPRIDSIFKLPTRGDFNTNMEITATMDLSDLWQVPLRKRVAYDQLEITSLSIVRLIMDIKLETIIAYNMCVYEGYVLKVVQNITEKAQEIRDRMYYRQQFGFTSDFEKDFADATLGKWQAMLIEQQARLKQAFLHLRKMLSFSISSQPLHLIDSFVDYELRLSASKTLEAYALEHRPEMAVAHFKIKKAEDELSLQRAKVIDTVTFGIGYEQDFEDARGIGPAFGIQVPFFNANQGNIARAKFQKQQAEQEQRAQRQFIQKEVQHAYIELFALKGQIELFETKVIPATQHAIEYAQTFHDRMQLNMIVLLESQLSLLETHKQLLALRLQFSNVVAQLERASAQPILTANHISLKGST